MWAISGRKMIQVFAADHATHTIQVSQWKRQQLDLGSLSPGGKKTMEKEEAQGTSENPLKYAQFSN
jgi:hypothetical protein